MLSHRLSGFTGPVPSAALDKSVFSCFLRNILSCLRRNVKNSLTLFIQHSKIDQEDRFEQQKHSFRCAFVEKNSVTFCLFAVQQLDRAGSAQTVRAQREELLDKTCAAIEQRVQHYNATAPAGSFQLSFSTGVAKYEGGSVEKFLVELDQRMYAEKRAFHAARDSHAAPEQGYAPSI